MAETWRPIVDFEGLYEVSDLGRARSLGRTQLIRNRWGGSMERRLPAKLLKLIWADHRGLVVNLYRGDGTRRQVEIALVVLEAFVGAQPDGLHGLHRDDNKRNNQVGNLYWGTPSQNNYDASRNGRNWQTHKTHCKNKHAFTPENTIIRSDNGCRQCRACNRDAQRRRRSKR